VYDTYSRHQGQGPGVRHEAKAAPPRKSLWNVDLRLGWHQFREQSREPL